MILYFMFQSQQASYLEECRLKGITGDCSLWDKIIGDFKSVKWVWIIVILLVYMLSSLARALRWNQILDAEDFNPRLINTLGALMVGYFVNLGVPRAGELVRTGLLSKYENIPIEKVLASVVIDRVADVISLLVVLGFTVVVARGLIIDFLTENVQTSTLITLGIAAVVGLCLAIVGYFIIRHQSKQGNTSWLVTKAQSFFDSLMSIRHVKHLPLFICYTVVIWLCYYFMTYLCFFAFAPTAHLSMLAGLIVFVFGTLGIVFPSPGGMGSYHLLVTSGLLLFGISSSDAFSFANIVFFAIQLFCNVLIGGLFFLCLPYINRRLHAA